jgi:hypothetical protein
MVGRVAHVALAGADVTEALPGGRGAVHAVDAGLERELRETATLECTDRVPTAGDRRKMAAEGGRAKLQERLTALKRM